MIQLSRLPISLSVMSHGYPIRPSQNAMSAPLHKVLIHFFFSCLPYIANVSGLSRQAQPLQRPVLPTISHRIVTLGGEHERVLYVLTWTGQSTKKRSTVVVLMANLVRNFRAIRLGCVASRRLVYRPTLG
jgi:hypothetical protein